MSAFLHRKAHVFLCVAAVVLFAANAFAQDLDTAYIPFNVNVNATATAQLGGGEKFEKPVRAGSTDTLLVIAGGEVSPVISGKMQRPVATYYTLYSLNGKQLMHGETAASEAGKSISHPNVAMGIYLLSAKEANGSTFTTRLAHNGGRLNINAAFANESIFSPMEKALSGEWTITVSAEGYLDTSYALPLETGRGNTPVQNITLRQVSSPSSSSRPSSSSLSPSSSSSRPPSSSSSQPSSSSLSQSSSSGQPSSSSSSPFVPFGFEPEMLGLAPGATIAELRFNWYSDSSSANNKSCVRVYDASGAVVAEKDTTMSRNGATAGKRYHKIAVTGLAPNTEYKYSVSNNCTEWSNRYDYKTPKASAFKFAATGDQHQVGADRTIAVEGTNITIKDNAIEVWGQTLSKIAARGVDFIAGVGDQVDSSTWSSLAGERGYKNFFAPPQMKSIPYAAAMGNHDIDSAFFLHFNLPNYTSGNAPWVYDMQARKTVINGNYWYLYNNVLFVVLNTSMFYPSDLAGAQSSVERFDATFTSAKAAHAGKYDWIIVQHHESTRSVGSHAEDKEVLLNKEAGFETLMDKHGVDIVFAGHDHVYVRTKPMKGGKAATDGKGTIYITLTAAASPKFYPIVTKLVDNAIMEKTLQNSQRGYAIFDINGKSLSFTAYRVDTDASVDSFTLSK